MGSRQNHPEMGYIPFSEGAQPARHRGGVEVSVSNREAVLSGLPFFFQIIAKIAQRIQFGALIFILPDGRVLTFPTNEKPEIEGVIYVNDFRFARRVVLSGDVGFFESFANEQWDTPNLAELLYVIALNADYVQEAFKAFPMSGWLNRLRHFFNRNSKSGSKRNIAAHYDLGNEFYERWLDPTMTYSSAIYTSPNQSLADAQIHKYRELARLIALQSGDHLLEIGSGWGGFAEYAGKLGASVTGLTLSREQLTYSRARIFHEDLADRVKFRLQDYRDFDEQVDKIASIEMFEAVGKEYWPIYFDKIHASLKPGGVAGLQIITIDDRFYDRYERGIDFIQRYVFPGGMLPSPSILREHIQRSGLSIGAEGRFGQDYARTLAEWHDRFTDAWESIKPLGYDHRFRKLWQFYLAYCEAGFRAGTTDVCQISASRI